MLSADWLISTLFALTKAMSLDFVGIVFFIIFLSRINGTVPQQHHSSNHHEEIEVLINFKCSLKHNIFDTPFLSNFSTLIQSIDRLEQPQASHYIKQEPDFLNSSGGDDIYSGNNFHSKHVCKVCGDRASGKHYGLYSCEGCKVIAKYNNYLLYNNNYLQF